MNGCVSIVSWLFAVASQKVKVTREIEEEFGLYEESKLDEFRRRSAECEA